MKSWFIFQHRIIVFCFSLAWKRESHFNTETKERVLRTALNTVDSPVVRAVCSFLQRHICVFFFFSPTALSTLNKLLCWHITLSLKSTYYSEQANSHCKSWRSDTRRLKSCKSADYWMNFRSSHTRYPIKSQEGLPLFQIHQIETIHWTYSTPNWKQKSYYTVYCMLLFTNSSQIILVYRLWQQCNANQQAT